MSILNFNDVYREIFKISIFAIKKADWKHHFNANLLL